MFRNDDIAVGRAFLNDKIPVFFIASMFFSFHINIFRVDHILIYTTFLFSLFGVCVGRLRLTCSVINWFRIVAAIVFLTIGLLSSLSNIAVGHDGTAFLAQLENYVQLLVTLFFLAFIVKRLTREVCKNCCDILIASLMVNAFFVLGDVTFDLKIFDIFHGGEVTERPEHVGITASDLASLGGRHTGVFGQVFEAGYAYTLGLMLLTLNHRLDAGRLIRGFSWVAILYGGWMTGSKIFLIFAVGLGAYFLLRSVKRQLLTLAALTVSFVMFSALEFEVQFPWYASRLLDAQPGDVVSVLTSGRFSADSSIISGMAALLQSGYYAGRGFGYLKTSDFALYEVLAIAGVLGVMVYLFLVLTLYSELFKVDIVAALFFSLLLFMTSIAGPVVTANKVGFFSIIIPHLWVQQKRLI